MVQPLDRPRAGGIEGSMRDLAVLIDTQIGHRRRQRPGTRVTAHRSCSRNERLHRTFRRNSPAPFHFSAIGMSDSCALSGQDSQRASTASTSAAESTARGAPSVVQCSRSRVSSTVAPHRCEPTVDPVGGQSRTCELSHRPGSSSTSAPADTAWSARITIASSNTSPHGPKPSLSRLKRAGWSQSTRARFAGTSTNAPPPTPTQPRACRREPAVPVAGPCRGG